MEAKNKDRPRGMDGAKLMLVIETKSLRGAGGVDDPCRYVTQYWSSDGKLLAEADGIADTTDEEYETTILY